MRKKVKFDILLVVGGMFQVLLRMAPSVLGARQLLHIDAKNEIDKCARPVLPEEDAITYQIPLGEGETSATIIKACGLVDHQLPVAACDEGLAQDRLLGRQTFLKDVAAYRALMKERVVPVMSKYRRGTLNGTRTAALSSLSGGAGSATQRDAVNELHQSILSQFEVTISHVAIYAGPLTHLGLGGGATGKNAGAAIAEIISANSPNDRVAYTHVFVDFANEIEDVDAREWKAGIFVESFLSSELQENMRVWIPNEARQHEFGNCHIVRMTDFLPLKNMVGQIAAHWQSACAPLLDPTINLSALSVVDFVDKRRSLPRESQESIEARALDIDARELVEAIERPGALHRVFCVANGEARRYDLGDIATCLGPITYTVEGLATRLMLLKTALHRLNDKMNQVVADVQQAESKLNDARKRTEAKHRALVRASWLSFAAPLSIDDIAEHRLALDEHRRQLSYRDALEVANGEVQKELASRKYEVELVLDRFKTVADPTALKSNRLIEPVNVDVHLRDLVVLSRAGEFDRIQLLLGTACERVTLEGLAAIVGAGEASPQEIVRAIHDETHADVGPWWGGVSGRPGGARFSYVVLPPLDPAHRAMIAESAREIGLKGVVMGDGCKCGPMVVKFGINPATLTDIMPQIAINGAREALADPKSSYYVEDPDQTRKVLEMVEKARKHNGNGSHP